MQEDRTILGTARGENVFNQSANLFTLSTTNQDTQKTIENEEKITSDWIQKKRLNHRPFAVKKNSSHKKLMLQVVFPFSGQSSTLSSNRYTFLKFYHFPSQNIVVKWRYLL